MKTLMLLSLSVLPFVLAALARAAETESPVYRNAQDFDVEGKGWSESGPEWGRFPARAEKTVPAAVWDLSRHAAGIAVRFTTDAPNVWVRWTLTSAALDMPHMPATGVSGLDLYARHKDGEWRFAANARPTQKDGNESKLSLPSGCSEFLLYLPLYNGVERLEIGALPAHQLTKARPRTESLARPIVYYGTSIAQGGCASRPGMAHVAIIGRMLDRPMVNLGFSGNGQMQQPVVDLLAELDPAAFVIEAAHNIGGLEDAEIERRVGYLIETVRRARPDTPLVFVGCSVTDPGIAPTRVERAQDRAVQTSRERGVKRLHTVPGKDLLGRDGEGTVDGVHPTDLGFQRHAEAIAPVLKGVFR